MGENTELSNGNKNPEASESAIQRETRRELKLLETLSRSLCHEFNNTLGGIAGYAQLALMNKDDHQLAERALLVATRGAQRLTELTSRLDRFAHADDSGASRYRGDLVELLRDCVALVKPELEHDCIHIILEGSDQAPILHNPVHLRMAILEVLHNASESIRQSENDDRRIVVTVAAHDTGCHSVTIDDTGVGFTRDAVERAFDPFFSTRDVISGGHGTLTRGMGLAIAMRTIEDHEGVISIGDAPDGMNARVSIEIPALESVDAYRGRIVIVDDEPRICHIYTRFLGQRGYSTVEFNRPEPAIEYLSESGADLILLDYLMPGMSGTEMLAELNKQNIHIPVIMITAAYDTKLARTLLGAGAREVTSKPINRERLLFMVERQLNLGGASTGESLSAQELSVPVCERILIIDSDDLTREMITMALERTGSVVEACVALEHAKKLTENQYYDLILIDPLLHDGRGGAAVHQLRINNPYTPILVLSGNVGPASIREAIRQGATDAFPKPLDILALITRVRQILTVFRPKNSVDADDHTHTVNQ